MVESSFVFLHAVQLCTIMYSLTSSFYGLCDVL